MKRLCDYLKKRFFTGLFAILPIAISVWIIYKIFSILDSVLGKVIYNSIGMKIYGLGLIVTLLLILVVGILINYVFGKKIINLVEKIFVKIPLINMIYAPIKDILKNFSNSKSNNFKRAVYVTYPMEGCHSIGFITKENIMINGEERTTIFIPTTPNPTSGFLVYLPKDKYQELDIPVDEALKTIISLGSFSPDIMKMRK